MDDQILQRINSAWNRTKSWITVCDGTVSEAYFVDITENALVHGLEKLQSNHASFAFRPVWDSSIGSRPETVRDLVSVLLSNDCSNAEIVFETSDPGFNARLLFLVDHMGPSGFDVDLVWWPDQAFPPGIDVRRRFSDLLSYLFYLQRLFSSPRFFIGPENLDNPRNSCSPWTEV